MKNILYGILILLGAGCKEIYNSPIKQSPTGYLVVEGVVNSGPGATTITLSRTANLDQLDVKLEQGAQVKVEREDNTSYLLAESSLGHYGANNLNLDPGQKYRLYIKTSDGKEYASDLVGVQTNPPIDSISWQRESGGVKTYVHTHDPQNNTKYYQWEYTETWEFHSRYDAVLKWVHTGPRDQDITVGYRDSTTFLRDPTLYYCWQSEASSNILTGSSVKLSSDVIYLPLSFIPNESWKLGVLYSINAKQYGLTKEGYEFLERMKKNTEGTGSIFDPQPSQLNGNFHCLTDAAEPVIGYFNISPIWEKRIFISNDQVPDWGYEQECTEYKLNNIGWTIALQGVGGLEPSYPAEISPLGGRIVSFYASGKECVDCRLRGTSVKPSFWP